MNVRELITALEGRDPEAEVVVAHRSHWYPNQQRLLGVTSDAEVKRLEGPDVEADETVIYLAADPDTAHHVPAEVFGLTQW